MSETIKPNIQPDVKKLVSSTINALCEIDVENEDLELRLFDIIERLTNLLGGSLENDGNTGKQKLIPEREKLFKDVWRIVSRGDLEPETQLKRIETVISRAEQEKRVRDEHKKEMSARQTNSTDNPKTLTRTTVGELNKTDFDDEATKELNEIGKTTPPSEIH